MSKLHTKGPESPFGRKRISTRNTKPLASCSAKKVIKRLPMRVNHSWFDKLFSAPTVSPSCSYRNIKSISDDRLSSSPPNFPMPTTIKGISVLVTRLQGNPKRTLRSERIKVIASETASWANRLRLWVTSSRLAIPFKSRKAIHNINLWRARRNSAMNCASSNSLLSLGFLQALNRSRISWASIFLWP